MAMLEVDLSVTPTRVSDDTPLDIRGAVRNLGASEVDTQVFASNLLVNGEPSETWLWSMNGLHDEREWALPPGERVEFRRILPASVLSGSGRYELVLVVQGIRSQPVIVERHAP
jgi:hypothetical protein